MTIYEIVYNINKTGSYYFSKDSLKMFHQRVSSFKVVPLSDGRYYIYAKSSDGREIKTLSEKIYNPVTNELEFVDTHDENGKKVPFDYNQLKISKREKQKIEFLKGEKVFI
jgi:hypothetical protein